MTRVVNLPGFARKDADLKWLDGFDVKSARNATQNNCPLYPSSLDSPSGCWSIQEQQDRLEPQMENIYYHKRPAIQEHNMSANKDMLAIQRRRRQLPFKIDGNSINPPP
jgi:hypothetical protein